MAVITASYMEIVEKCHSGEYKLPAFQRDFKWKRAQVMMLFDSLRQNLPIGSSLILKGESPINFSPRCFEFASPDAERRPHEFLVLDGQQRQGFRQA